MSAANLWLNRGTHEGNFFIRLSRSLSTRGKTYLQQGKEQMLVFDAGVLDIHMRSKLQNLQEMYGLVFVAPNLNPEPRKREGRVFPSTGIK